MHKISAFLIVTSLITLVACGPEKLTDARAKSLLQEAIAGSEQGNYSVGYSTVAMLLQRPSYIDYTQGTSSQAGAQALQRLVQGGLIVKKVDRLVFPDVSGKYDGSLFGHPIYATLETKPQSADISGSFLVDWGSWTGYQTPLNGCEGTLSGTVQVNNSLQLSLGFNKAYIGCFVPSEAILSLTRNKTDYDLVGLNQRLHLHGGSPGHEIAVPRFRYEPTEEFRHAIRTGNLISAGNVQVDHIGQLLLATDTVAEGQFAWHVDLSLVGRAITGWNEKRGNDSVRFARRPDGRWAVATFSLN